MESPESLIKSNYFLDCKRCVEDSLFETKELSEYLISKLKINGKTGQLGKKVLITPEADQVKIISQKLISKRYIKYLAKKFLYGRKIKDWVRLINCDKIGYRFVYYNVQKDTEE